MGNVINLLIILAFGVILAELVTKAQGTQTLINGIAGMWQTSVNGMLGNTTSSTGQATAVPSTQANP
jgi:hypothetical protein